MLCTICDALELSADDFIVGSLDRGSFYDKFNDLGTVAAVRERAIDCSLCKITLETVGLDTTSGRPEIENTPCKLFWQEDGFVQGEENPQKRFLKVFIKEWPENYPEFHRISLLVDDMQRGIDPLFLGRRIPEKVNIKQVRKWINSCERWHEVVCAGSVSILNHPLPAEFRVIDTWQLCLSTHGIADLTYLALSYVWGDPSIVAKLSKHNRMEMQQPGALRQDRIRLPRTIRDAMTLTSCLCFRYLWVDSLCIVQDDTADKAEMLSIMDNIYDRAFLTIIAATGQDSSAGLPGLRKSPRGVRQRIANLKPGLSVTSPKHLSDALEQSYYDTRGWTYQERMLSTRRLYFIDGQVIFHCRSAVYREDINLESWKITTCQDEVGYRFREGLKSSTEPQNVYLACVWEYSSRKLSHDDDVVNAFVGLAKIIVKMFIEVYPHPQHPLIGASSICGLPTPCFDWALLWTIQAPMQGRLESLWPSWSWCGWSGKVSFILSGMKTAALFEWLREETWIKWVACEQRTSGSYTAQVDHSQGRSPYFPAEKYPPVKVNSGVDDGTEVLTKHRLQDLCSFKLLHFATLAMTFRVQYAEKHHGSSYQYDICAPDDISCGTIWLDAAIHNRANRIFEFLALSAVTPANKSSIALPGQNRNDRGGYHVLMVSYREPDIIAERLGLGLVLQESMNEERGAVWKEVWLQ